ncbi:MAG: hypothetical protein HFJ94_07285 [Muribaculaceae bacterium]|nr:hypothetical protein [Muribaculaceae bacterium]
MSDKSFTSAERRGLILLLIIITLLLGIAVINRACNRVSPPAPLTEAAKSAHDSLISSIDSVTTPKATPKPKKKAGAGKKKAPDGTKRNYLSEPVQ